MSIRKRKGSDHWHVDIATPAGERIRHSAGTTDKKAAQEYHDRLKADLWRQHRLGEQASHPFEEAAIRFLGLCQGQRDYATKSLHVEYWRGLFRGRQVRSLKADEIMAGLPTHYVKYGKSYPVQNGTKNKYLATIRRLLNLCLEWEWIDRVPRLGRFEEPSVRVRWEPPHRIMALIDAMTLPWMKDAALVAVSTGMRENEQFSLQPGQVNLLNRSAWITHQTAKSKYARAVPLNEDSFGVIARRLDAAQRAGGRWIFTRDEGDGRKIGQHDRRVFQRACEMVGIEDFHWHDLRHTWASWHVQGIMTGTSTPLMVLKELGGWETIEMVQKYAHLAPSHLASFVGRGTFTSQAALEKETPPAREALVA